MDIEDLDRKLERCLAADGFAVPTDLDIERYRHIIHTDFARACMESQFPDSAYRRWLKSHDLPYVQRSFLIQIAYALFEKNELDASTLEHVIDALRIKRGRSISGVLVITVFTSAIPTYTDPKTGETKTQDFSCAYDCAYCPKQNGQPRSYLALEPGVLRANRAKFDCCQQMWTRMEQLFRIGHTVDKLEVLVLGGTWSSYPLPYREQFIRDIYYSANVFWCRRTGNRRLPSTLEYERTVNKDAQVKVIGLTLETRPDCINPVELKHFRSYGCTRVQLGVQHLDDDILRGINRRCLTRHTQRAIEMLKNAAFKVDLHFMPNLPHSTAERDRAMLIHRFLGLKQRSVLGTPILGVSRWEVWDLVDESIGGDQVKLYPCAVTPYTEIEKWYKEGSYVPYPEEELLNLLVDTKAAMFPWIRVNRIIRDIPSDYIIASSDHGHWGAVVVDVLAKQGRRCRCIRCREVRSSVYTGDYQLVVRQYGSSGRNEYFISAESDDNKETLYGFLRLREGSSDPHKTFPELTGCALIRELHVYGQLQDTSKVSRCVTATQHKGLGRMLLSTAEAIARQRGFGKVAVIAGEGSKRYYEKFGYSEDGAFIVKELVQ